MIWWAAFCLIFIVSLTGFGFYRIGYTRGYLASHEIVMEMNENLQIVAKVARDYEKAIDTIIELTEQENVSDGRRH